MAWIESLRNWLGVPKQENISDPRLYDEISNDAQFGAPEADRLERANPSVPEDLAPEDNGPLFGEGGFDIDDVGRDSRNIEMVETSGWVGLDGLWESRTSIGKSDEGWHYSVETSYQGDDGRDTGWSTAYPTQEQAEEAKHAAYNRIMEPHEQEAEAREAREIRDFEKRDERLVDEILQEAQARRRQEISGGVEL